MIRYLINRLICLFKRIPYRAENADIFGKDNDGDGFKEKEFVEGHYKNGLYVKSYYRKNRENI